MGKKRLFFGILFIAGAIVLRQFPRLITGLSWITLLQAAGFVLLGWGIGSRFDAIRVWIKGAASRRYAAAIGVVVILLALFEFAGAVNNEIECGRIYAKIEPELEKTDAKAGRRLASWLPHTESPQLRRRVLDRIAKVGVADREAAEIVRDVIRNDPDPEVRKAAAGALAAVLSPRSALSAVASLPGLDPERLELFGNALTKWSGESHADAAGWRRWLTGSWAGTEGEESFEMAVTAWRIFPDDAAAREKSLARLRTVEGVSAAALSRLAVDDDPRLREVAALRIGEKGQASGFRHVLEALDGEKDAAAAAAQVEALLSIDEVRACRELIRIARVGGDGAGAEAVAAVIRKRFPGLSPDDPGAAMAAMHRGAKTEEARKGLFPEVVRAARESPAARAELKRVASNPSAPLSHRIKALAAVLDVDAASVTDSELVDIMVGARPDLAQALRTELRKRTGKDGGRDPAKWREILRGE